MKPLEKLTRFSDVLKLYDGAVNIVGEDCTILFETDPILETLLAIHAASMQSILYGSSEIEVCGNGSIGIQFVLTDPEKSVKIVEYDGSEIVQSCELEKTSFFSELGLKITYVFERLLSDYRLDSHELSLLVGSEMFRPLVNRYQRQLSHSVTPIDLDRLR